ncbi:hypothetical protein MKW94_002396 [Papaver nudicaule]|uniref:RNA helicase n=1 Tax=Papaver nudicaule TaxID=74823 RepID=A0AA41V678_PAPNU|nr:hypothetical protein [Papaver nudicaule]
MRYGGGCGGFSKINPQNFSLSMTGRSMRLRTTVFHHFPLRSYLKNPNKHLLKPFKISNSLTFSDTSITRRWFSSFTASSLNRPLLGLGNKERNKNDKGLVVSSAYISSNRRQYSQPSNFQQHNQSFQHGRYAYDDYSEDEYGGKAIAKGSQSNKGASSLENIDEWKRKLTMLIRSNNEHELVSREKKDRRDFDQLSALATRMGLYSRQYSRVLVFSKSPLPNYRSDLDDKRPQREVIISSDLQRRVESLLNGYLSQKPRVLSLPKSNSSGESSTLNDDFVEQQDIKAPTSVVMERILRRRNLHFRDRQQAWKESAEGKRMIEFRESLPAYKEKDALLRAISQNQVVVVSGETGCGKTTQLPQYILESEIEVANGSACNIICTQPRRISAMAVSERVAAERGEKLGETVGYKVRLEGQRGRDTRLLFCTTGILLRRLLHDKSLKGVTHVIVDEIHERGMNEDFLLIILRDLLPRRPELRLILMSATLNAELFSTYFGGAPMMHIPGFTYPVRTLFLESILETVGYRLTPYNQIDDYGQDKLWKKQKQFLGKRKSQIVSVVEDTLEAANFNEYSRQTQESLSCWNPDSLGFNLIERVLCHICKKEKPGAVLVFMTGWDDINALKDQLQAHPLLGDPSRTLLLACHGSMATSEQRLIFDKPEDGVRKIVLATNMAETSITINDVVFVVDCGKAKETSYDALNNTPCLLPSWISKAAARQRRGRAGRVQPGECYHLYPRCVYEGFVDYQLPELLRTPLQSLCLQIKSLQLGSISEFLSRALQSPEPLSVQNAVEYLKVVGALDEKENLTNLGGYLSMLPVEPKLGKMLILGAIFKCVDPILTVVAGLSSRDPFLAPFDKKDLADSVKAQFAGRDCSDHLALVRAFKGWKDAEKEQSGYEYCWKNFLSSQTLRGISSLNKQFFYLLKDTGLVDNDPATWNTWSHDEHLIKAIICAGLYPGICSVVNKDKCISLKTMEDGEVNLSSNSVNAREPKIQYPWLVFNEKVKVNSVYLRESTAISDSLVLLFGGSISRGGLDGHLKMLGGYLEFFMKPALAETYLILKRELDELIHNKLLNPKMDINTHQDLLSAVRLLLSQDQCDGKFVFGRKVPIKQSNVTIATSKSSKGMLSRKGSVIGGGGDNCKNQLQTLLLRGGHQHPVYNTRQLKNNNQFRAMVEFNGMQFAGKPCGSKKLAEKDAAAEALHWLTGETGAPTGWEEIDDHKSILQKLKIRKHIKAR